MAATQHRSHWLWLTFADADAERDYRLSHGEMARPRVLTVMLLILAWTVFRFARAEAEDDLLGELGGVDAAGGAAEDEESEHTVSNEVLVAIAAGTFGVHLVRTLLALRSFNLADVWLYRSFVVLAWLAAAGNLALIRADTSELRTHWLFGLLLSYFGLLYAQYLPIMIAYQAISFVLIADSDAVDGWDRVALFVECAVVGSLFNIGERHREVTQRHHFVFQARLRSENIDLSYKVDPFSAGSLRRWVEARWHRHAELDEESPAPAAGASAEAAAPKVELQSPGSWASRLSRRLSSVVGPPSPRGSVTVPASAEIRADPAHPWALDEAQLSLDSRIGAGGSGLVWRGRLNAHPVAVKELFAFHMGDEGLEDFGREASLLSQLRHPQIVRFYGIAVKERSLYIVTELAACSLHDVLYEDDDDEHHVQWQPERVAGQVAAAMAYLVDSGVVHRDLKPGNVLLTAAGDAKLCDFGLGAQHAGGRSASMTANVGTPAFMAPELMSAERVAADNTLQLSKGDVYAFGVLLWCIATRQIPYDGVNYIAVMHGVANDGMRPPPPQDSPWAALMQRCWAQDPEERPTFEELARELS